MRPLLLGAAALIAATIVLMPDAAPRTGAAADADRDGADTAWQDGAAIARPMAHGLALPCCGWRRSWRWHRRPLSSAIRSLTAMLRTRSTVTITVTTATDTDHADHDGYGRLGSCDHP